MVSINKKGFSTVELVFVVGLIAIISILGFLAINRSDDSQTEQNPTAASSQVGESSSNQEGEAALARITDTWLLHENDFYSVRIPDGWTLCHTESTGTLASSLCGDDTPLVYEEGVAAQVVEGPGGIGGFFEFIMHEPGKDEGLRPTIEELEGYVEVDLISAGANGTNVRVFSTTGDDLDQPPEGFDYPHFLFIVSHDSGQESRAFLSKQLPDGTVVDESRRMLAEEMLFTMELI